MTSAAVLCKEILLILQEKVIPDLLSGGVHNLITARLPLKLPKNSPVHARLIDGVQVFAHDWNVDEVKDEEVIANWLSNLSQEEQKHLFKQPENHIFL